MLKIFCEHCKTELTLEQDVKKWKSESYFAKCSKCLCVFRLYLVNDLCYSKRFPNQKTSIPEDLKPKKVKESKATKNKKYIEAKTEDSEDDNADELEKDKGEL